MALTSTMKIVEDTVLKQKPVDSTKIEDPNGIESVSEGSELQLEAWKKVDNTHIEATVADGDLNGQSTWYAYTGHVQIFQEDHKIPLRPKGLSLKVIEDTILKQKPVDSRELNNPKDKHSLTASTEIDLQSWKKAQQGHIRIELANQEYEGQNVWYILADHVEVWCGSRKIPLAETQQVGDVTSCSTHVVRGLDQQIIEELNNLIPDGLISFETLDIDPGPGVWPFLQPGAREALARAIRERGRPMQINSAYRTVAQQLILYNHYINGRCNIQKAAKPGDSLHQNGRSIDIPDPELYSWKPYLEKHGWRWFGPGDVFHFDCFAGGTRDYRPDSIRAFQKLWNRYNADDQIAEDGIWGPATEERLNRAPAKGFNKTVDNTQILRLQDPYMQGEQVQATQEALTRYGFEVRIDGIYGPKTKAAVKEFQEQRNLNIDGIVGPEALSELGLYCEAI